MDNFSQRVKEARTTKKLTQKELAERIGTTESNINNYEKGRNKPTTDMLVKICTNFLCLRGRVIKLA